jgi:hypothetical protein
MKLFFTASFARAAILFTAHAEIQAAGATGFNAGSNSDAATAGFQQFGFIARSSRPSP